MHACKEGEGGALVKERTDVFKKMVLLDLLVRFDQEVGTDGVGTGFISIQREESMVTESGHVA